jgi:uncharacterized protein YecT (DUF1311 family)
MRRVLIALWLVLAAPTNGIAAEPPDPIDLAWEDCAGGGEGPNAEQMLACHLEAHQAWDRAMVEAYEDLLKRLKPSSRALLVESQRQWAAFRDAEIALWQAQSTGDDDLNAEVNLHSAAAEIARARALYLCKFGDYFWTD